MAGNKNFDQEQYWIQRHERLKNDPRSVGHLGKSLEENLLAERVLVQWVDRAARLLKPYSSVLDVGCGYGRVATVFCDLGYDYTGIDISPVAIDAARSREPRGSYLVGSALDLQYGAKVDLVCALYVLTHFVDDEKWNSLLNKLIDNIKPGGGLLFADELPNEILRPAPHVAQRPLALYEELFKSRGMQMDTAFRDNLSAALESDGIELPPVHLARRVGE